MIGGVARVDRRDGHAGRGTGQQRRAAAICSESVALSTASRNSRRLEPGPDEFTGDSWP